MIFLSKRVHQFYQSMLNQRQLFKRVLDPHLVAKVLSILDLSVESLSHSQLLNDIKIVHYHKGQVIIKEGDQIAQLHVLLEGEAVIYETFAEYQNKLVSPNPFRNQQSLANPIFGDFNLLKRQFRFQNTIVSSISSTVALISAQLMQASLNSIQCNYHRVKQFMQKYYPRILNFDCQRTTFSYLKYFSFEHHSSKTTVFKENSKSKNLVFLVEGTLQLIKRRMSRIHSLAILDQGGTIVCFPSSQQSFFECRSFSQLILLKISNASLKKLPWTWRNLFERERQGFSKNLALRVQRFDNSEKQLKQLKLNSPSSQLQLPHISRLAGINSRILGDLTLTSKLQIQKLSLFVPKQIDDVLSKFKERQNKRHTKKIDISKKNLLKSPQQGKSLNRTREQVFEQLKGKLYESMDSFKDTFLSSKAMNSRKSLKINTMFKSRSHKKQDFLHQSILQISS